MLNKVTNTTDNIQENQERLYQERLKMHRRRHGLSERELRRRANDPKRVRSGSRIRQQDSKKHSPEQGTDS